MFFVSFQGLTAKVQDCIFVDYLMIMYFIHEMMLESNPMETRQKKKSNPIWGTDFAEFPVDSILTLFHLIFVYHSHIMYSIFKLIP